MLSSKFIIYIYRSNEAFIDSTEYINELNLLPDFVSSLNEYKSKLNALIETKWDEYPKIVFLGTGSCVPNKTRNVSSILLHTTYVLILLTDNLPINFCCVLERIPAFCLIVVKEHMAKSFVSMAKKELRIF